MTAPHQAARSEVTASSHAAAPAPWVRVVCVGRRMDAIAATSLLGSGGTLREAAS